MMKQFVVKHKTLAFVLFEDKIQVYHAFHGITASFCATLSIICFLVPMWVFNMLATFGIAGLLLGATTVMVATLEILHFVCDWSEYARRDC